jgi:phospholipid N-methyltransferase
MLDTDTTADRAAAENDEQRIHGVTATYSPDDNKLRISCAARFDRATYDRLRAAGYGWAPKQQQFIAPMWTPAREDLAIELAGSIDDEDSTLMDRAEDRAERFEGYQERRADEAEAVHRAVASIADGIPFGQPILVGHHSERRARKDAERIQNGMRRAVRLWDTADYWNRRAAAALQHAKYKERPDVRARRIKTIEADRRKMERTKAAAATFLAAFRDTATRSATLRDGRPLLPALLATYDSGLSFEAQRQLERGELAFEDALQQAIDSRSRVVAWADRWIAHYDHRLGYERAMLAAVGGTAADQAGPQKGGGCQCWASPRGGWSFIQKVNKVSVTVLDNWGNGGKNFTRTISFDNLARLMSPAEIAEARGAGRVVDSPNGIGFFLRAPAPDAEAATAAEVPAAPSVAPAAAPADPAEALREALRQGVQVAVAPSLFPTPTWLAERMADEARLFDGARVLEPSAGTGQLLRALRATGRSMHIVAVEMHAGLCDGLARAFCGAATDVPQAVELIPGDFLATRAIGAFDVVLMNPPFDNGADIAHIRHARSLLRPGGRLVALCAAGPRQHAALRPLVDACGGVWEPLPDDTFAACGTRVRAVLLTLTAPGD